MRGPLPFILAALLAVTACGGKNRGADAAAGAGGHSGVGGQSGAAGVAGVGGQSGAGGGPPFATCPTGRPAIGAPCSGSVVCSYTDRCVCGACCSIALNCVNGSFAMYGYNDACVNVRCEDGGTDATAGTGGAAGTGGTGGAAGAGGIGGRGGTGGTGGAAGAGGTGGGGDCPAERPANGAACSGYYFCTYPETCRCGVCCGWTHRCDNGTFIDLGVSNECYFVTCADAGTVCRPGNAGTCNDSPNWAGIYGRCTDAGTCECFDSGINPETGRCYQALPQPHDASSSP